MEESIWARLPADIVKEIAIMVDMHLGVLNKAAYETLKKLDLYPKLHKATTELRSNLLSDIKRMIESAEERDKQVLEKFLVFVESNFYTSNAPSPPTLMFMNKIISESHRMLKTYIEAGSVELGKLIFKRTYLWSAQKGLVISKQERVVALTVQRLGLSTVIFESSTTIIFYPGKSVPIPATRSTITGEHATIVMNPLMEFYK